MPDFKGAYTMLAVTTPVLAGCFERGGADRASQASPDSALQCACQFVDIRMPILHLRVFAEAVPRQSRTGAHEPHRRQMQANTLCSLTTSWRPTNMVQEERLPKWGSLAIPATLPSVRPWLLHPALLSRQFAVLLCLKRLQPPAYIKLNTVEHILYGAP